jgi:molecular chaperone GrpE
MMPAADAFSAPSGDGRIADIVEEASAESFPASDPPAWTPVRGTRVAPDELARATGGIMLDGLRAKLSALTGRLARTLEQHDDARRCAERDLDLAVRFASAALIRDLLDTADNLRHAIDSVSPVQVTQGGVPAEDSVRGLLAGLAATEADLLGTLARHGVARLEPAPGSVFDPNHHEALLVVEDADRETGTVAQLLQPGYIYHERLLRPALVAVAK